MTDSSNSTDEY